MPTPKYLKYTKRKLSIIFTLIVFAMAFLVEGSFLTVKYYQLSVTQIRDFTFLTDELAKRFEWDSDLFREFLLEWFGFHDSDANLRFINFIVLDGERNIKTLHVNRNFQINIDSIIKTSHPNVQKVDDFLVRSSDISFFGPWFGEIIFLQKINYGKKEYVSDMTLFFLFILLFCVVFYSVGLFFVDKNLRPVEETFADMNDFIHNANHELRTPIAVISSNLQLMKASRIYDGDLIFSSLLEIGRIDSLVFELSKFSDIHSAHETDLLNIKDEIERVLAEYQKEIDAKHIRIQLKLSAHHFVAANRNYFYILFVNVLRNALKYNLDDNGIIEIESGKNWFSVTNTGEQIPKKIMGRIFDRFFVWKKDGTGFGIGLSLVKKIADLYNWHIRVESDHGKTKFLFEW